MLPSYAAAPGYSSGSGYMLGAVFGDWRPGELEGLGVRVRSRVAWYETAEPPAAEAVLLQTEPQARAQRPPGVA